jgi:hypothetical protein
MTDALYLLGGAERRSTRPRGFVPWSPRTQTQHLINQVKAVLKEYAPYLPLTIRQIFYRLVGAHDYPKTQQGYEKLCEHLNRARRADFIEMDAIRDDGSTIIEPDRWQSAIEYLRAIQRDADTLTLDRSEGQDLRLVVSCEAAGMAPQLARIANPLGVSVFSSGGFDSLTDKHRFASELADHDRPTEVLHIGDHDPSGVHLFYSFQEDVEAFALELGGEVTFTRLAVTPDQIDAYRLPTAPKKATDRCAFAGKTCQAEALAPDDLAGIVRRAIEARIDQATLDEVLEREQRERKKLRRILAKVLYE